jgi:hypothetical protein
LETVRVALHDLVPHSLLALISHRIDSVPGRTDEVPKQSISAQGEPSQVKSHVSPSVVQVTVDSWPAQTDAGSKAPVQVMGGDPTSTSSEQRLVPPVPVAVS